MCVPVCVSMIISSGMLNRWITLRFMARLVCFCWRLFLDAGPSLVYQDGFGDRTVVQNGPFGTQTVTQTDMFGDRTIVQRDAFGDTQVVRTDVFGNREVDRRDMFGNETIVRTDAFGDREVWEET
jgi:hypothetical protein